MPMQHVACTLHLANYTWSVLPAWSGGRALWCHRPQPPFKRHYFQELIKDAEKVCLVQYNTVCQTSVIPKHLQFKSLSDKVGWFQTKVTRTVESLEATAPEVRLQKMSITSLMTKRPRKTWKPASNIWPTLISRREQNCSVTSNRHHTRMNTEK